MSQSFNKEQYWKNRKNTGKLLDKAGNPVKDEEGNEIIVPQTIRGQGAIVKPVPEPTAPLSIVDDKIVVENRELRRRKAKGRDYTFFRRKGFMPALGAIKIKRVRNGKIKHKLIEVTIDKP